MQDATPVRQRGTSGAHELPAACFAGAGQVQLGWRTHGCLTSLKYGSMVGQLSVTAPYTWTGRRGRPGRGRSALHNGSAAGGAMPVATGLPLRANMGKTGSVRGGGPAAHRLPL